MERLSRLAAVVATCLPAGAWLSPALIPAPISNGNGLLCREGSTHSRRPRPLFSAAAGTVAWSAEGVTAAREALINSEGFRTLVKRAEARTSDRGGGGVKDSSLSSKGDDAAAGIIAMSAATSTHSRLTAPAIAAEGAAEAEVAEEKEKKVVSKSPWGRPSPWKQNAHKLESLRATVLDSEKAREIAASIRGANGSTSTSTSTSTSPPTRHETTPPWVGDVASPATSTDGSAQQAGREGFSDEVGPRKSERAFAVRGGRGGAGDGEGGGRRPPGIRWVRRVASKARGRVAAVVGRVARSRGENISG